MMGISRLCSHPAYHFFLGGGSPAFFHFICSLCSPSSWKPPLPPSFSLLAWEPWVATEVRAGWAVPERLFRPWDSVLMVVC